MPGNLYNKGMVRGAGILGRSGIIASSLAQALQDAAAYRALLASNGKALPDADYNALVSFASTLYSAVGRCDFFMARNSQNMGSGATAYTFHGKPVTLVNGGTWGADGITFPAGAYLSFAGATVPAAPAALLSVSSGYNLPGDFSSPVHYGGGFNSTHRGWQAFSNSVMYACNGTRADISGFNNTLDTRLFQVIRPANSLTSYSAYDGTTLRADATGTPSWDTLTANTPVYSGPVHSSYAGTAKLAFLLCAAIDMRASYLAIRTAYRNTIGAGLGIPTTAIDDAENYRATLASAGKFLLDADYQQIVSFASQLYAAVGRQDFLMLRSSQNVGSGSTAYTFHGQPCTLVNGATWGANEMTFSGVDMAVRRATNILPAAPPATVIHVGTTRNTFSGNYGGQIGGRYGYLGLGVYSTLRWSAENGPDAMIYAGGQASTRKFVCATVSGEQAGNLYVDGTVSGSTAGGTNYSSIARDTITNMGGTGNNGSSASNATSFVLIASGDFSAQAGAIRTAYKSTIGSGLSLL